jgi:hypothetical protein
MSHSSDIWWLLLWLRLVPLLLRWCRLLLLREILKKFL